MMLLGNNHSSAWLECRFRSRGMMKVEAGMVNRAMTPKP